MRAAPAHVMQAQRRRGLVVLGLAMALGANLGLSGCGGGGDESASVEIQFATVSRGSQSNLNTSGGFLSLVVRTSTDWQDLWLRHSILPIPLPLPSVLFPRFMVVAIVVGDRPSGCHAVNVLRVRVNDDHVEVSYRVSETAGHCPPGSGSPYEFIVIPATDLPVRFQPL